MNFPLLLDTCAAIWLMDDRAMRAAGADALDSAADADEAIYISPITAWEIGNLARKGYFTASMAPKPWFARLLAAPRIRLCDMPPKVLLDSAFLPGNIHKDPADRIIAATAREYGYTVVTRDRALLDYGQEGHIRAVEC